MGNGTEINGGGTERQTDCQSRERITSGENTLAGIISGLGQKVCCNETGTSHIIVWIKDKNTYFFALYFVLALQRMMDVFNRDNVSHF